MSFIHISFDNEPS